MRRLVALATAALLLLSAPALADPASRAARGLCARTASPSGTTFDVHGSGAHAFLGGWETHGRKASLCFQGVGGVGGSNTVVATWTTPLLRTTVVEGYSVRYHYASKNPAGPVRFLIEDRGRARRGKWRSWGLRDVRTIEPPAGQVSRGLGELSIRDPCSGCKITASYFRWEWRLIVRIGSPSALDVRLTASVTAS